MSRNDRIAGRRESLECTQAHGVRRRHVAREFLRKRQRRKRICFDGASLVAARSLECGTSRERRCTVALRCE